MPDYDEFLDELDKVWAECLRILVPGGRVACVVGDVCISRRQGGRHYVLPLSGDIQVRGSPDRLRQPDAYPLAEGREHEA